MSLINIINLSLTFSGKSLFKDLGFQVESGDRIGLVGPNGSGKTSLLRMITGELSPEKGEIRVSSGIRLGYLPQDIHDRLSGYLLKSVLESIPGRRDLQNNISQIEKRLDKSPVKTEQEKLALHLAEIHSELDRLDNEFPNHNAEKILEGLGFQSRDFQSPLSSFSGGWRMRAALGSILYQAPDLLLLDEPTNHLDIPSVRWLEQFLTDYRGAVILVCHDRDFLNRQINRVISFEPEGIRNYSGNYDQYLKFREEEKKTLEANARNQEIKVKEAKKFIERFRYKATKARQAQSKIKLLKKIELVKSHRSHKAMSFRFPEVPRSGRVVARIQGLSKSFGEKTLYKDIDLTVMRNERVAIIGPNGSGKTTLLKMLAGEIEPTGGRIELGHNVSMSYYAQHHSEMLDPGKTIIDEVYQIVPNESVSFVRGVCGAFLFSGDEVDKQIKVLSGGERARVCIAEMLIKPGNLLVMDEPTNHLDLVSSEILIDALDEFSGTLIFVSHNQSFINRLATKIWDLENGKITEYPGKLYEYYDHLERKEYETRAKREKTGFRAVDTRDVSSGDGLKKRLLRKEKAEKRKLISNRLNPIRCELSRIEERIAKLEEKERDLSKQLADPEVFRDIKKSSPLLGEYGRVRKELEDLMSRWENSQARLESAEKELGI
ncbi:MAG: ATP-binding cassette domain-containing protein [Deltaproteobacteria bacterium]|nr:ATP-binding cassette domain-containing protein [Deltaproteobacteria bacterium]